MPLLLSFWLSSQRIQILLHRIVEQYNFIYNEIEKCEFDIISDEIKMIDIDVQALTTDRTWINFGKRQE